MKFIVDNQLPPSLSRLLADAGHDSVHVAMVGLDASSDETLWAWAVREDRIVVNKDEDRFFLANRGGDRGRLLWVRIGNCRRERVHERALTHKTPRGGFEPPTTRLEGACSIQLSYRGRSSMVSEERGETVEKSVGCAAKASGVPALSVVLGGVRPKPTPRLAATARLRRSRSRRASGVPRCDGATRVTHGSGAPAMGSQPFRSARVSTSTRPQPDGTSRGRSSPAGAITTR